MADDCLTHTCLTVIGTESQDGNVFMRTATTTMYDWSNTRFNRWKEFLRRQCIQEHQPRWMSEHPTIQTRSRIGESPSPMQLKMGSP